MRKAAIEIEFDTPPKDMRKKFTAAIASGMRAAGLHWVNHYLRLHFTEGAYARYSYDQRTGGATDVKFHDDTHFRKGDGTPYRRIKVDGKWRTVHGQQTMTGGTFHGYTGRKMKIKGHNKPLVWSGTLQREVIASANVEDANKSGATVRMRGPRWLAGYIAFKGKQGTGPDKKRELTTVIPEETRGMARVVESRIADEMNKRGASA